MTTLAEVRTRALRALVPPARLRLSEWVEKDCAAGGLHGVAGPGASLSVSARSSRSQAELVRPALIEKQAPGNLKPR
jgi:hypothetical protein